jgi:hypothetical protein
MNLGVRNNGSGTKHFGELLCARYAGYNEKKEKRNNVSWLPTMYTRKTRAFRYPLWNILRMFTLFGK